MSALEQMPAFVAGGQPLRVNTNKRDASQLVLVVFQEHSLLQSVQKHSSATV